MTTRASSNPSLLHSLCAAPEGKGAMPVPLQMTGL